MAISAGVLLQVFLVILFRGEEILQRFQFHRKLLSGFLFTFDSCVMLPLEVIATGDDATPTLPAFLPERFKTGGFHTAINQWLASLPRIRKTPDHWIDGGGVGAVRCDHRDNIRWTDFALCFQRPGKLSDHTGGEWRRLRPVNIRPQLWR